MELLLLPVKINGEKLTALLDTGAIRSFVKEPICKRAKLKEEVLEREECFTWPRARSCALCGRPGESNQKWKDAISPRTC